MEASLTHDRSKNRGARSLTLKFTLSVLALVAAGCTNKADAPLKECQRLRSEGSLDEAVKACEQAVASDAKSSSGQQASTLLAALRAAVARANADKQATEAFKLWDGQGISKDQPSAQRSFDTSCQQGSPLGCAGLGVSFLDGVNGTGKDYTKALLQLASPCNAKVARACSALAFMHLRGLGTPKEGREAARSGKTSAMLKIFNQHLKTEQSRNEMDELASLVRKGGPVCLLCYERDPAQCHRNRVAEIICERTGIKVEHLHPSIGQI